MKSIIIIEAGSSKTSWVYVKNGEKSEYLTDGFNPLVHHPDDFQFPPPLKERIPNKIFYYGTGIIDENSSSIVQSMLYAQFNKAIIEIHDDLIAAARSTLGDKAGGIGILGTGSNSAFYGGHKLVKKIPALGYILGDEGGGVDIGKRIIRGYFYNEMPAEVNALFSEKYGLEKSVLLQELKNNPFPNRYLASFASFLTEIEGNWKKNLLLDSFSSFFQIRKKDFEQNELNCFVGSIAYVFQDTLIEAGKKHNIEISKITKAPINGLVKYHIEKNYE